MEETEQADEATAKHAAERAERQAKHAAAGLPDMEVLFDEVMLKAEDGSTSKVATLVQFAEPLQVPGAIRRDSAQFCAQFGAILSRRFPTLQAFREQIDSAIDTYVAAALELQEAKVAERAQFASALEGAKAQSAAEAMGEIAKYSALKKRTLRDPSAHPAAAVETLTQANDALYELLMDIELSQVERYAAGRVSDRSQQQTPRASSSPRSSSLYRYAAAIMAFEVAYDGLSKKTSEATQAFFNSARDMETAYHEEMVAVGTALLEKLAENEAELDALPEDARLLLQDKDALLGALGAAHDQRISKLDAKEDETRAIEEKNLKAVGKQVHEDEYHRNRTRVTEVYNLCRHIHKRELDEFAGAE